MKIILLILVVFAIAYYAVIYFVFKGNLLERLFIRRKKEKDIIITTTAKVFDETDLIGKSMAIAPIPYSMATEPLEIDIAIEYEVDENLDEESIELEEQGFTEFSTGVTFDELQLVVDTIQNENLPVETKTEIGGIIAGMGQTTDMFELLLQFSKGQQKIDDLLKIHVDKVENRLENSNTSQLELFELR